MDNHEGVTKIKSRIKYSCIEERYCFINESSGSNFLVFYFKIAQKQLQNTRRYKLYGLGVK